MRDYFKNNVLVIKREELKKFIPMFIIGSFVIFNFIMLRQLKDSLLISSMGAKALPIAKVAFVMPASILFMFAYNKLSDYFDARSTFIGFVLFFGIAFGIYTAFFQYNSNYIVGYLFYTLAECWNTVVFGTCMWAFFNDVCSVNEAQRFYVLISGAQIGSLLASASAYWLVRWFGKDGYVTASMLLVIGACLGILVVVTVCKSVLANLTPFNVKKSKGKSDYRGIFQGLLLILRSRYLFLILLITLSYNFTIVVTEFVWKSHVELAYPLREQMFVFFGNVSFWTTTIASLFAIFFTGGIMRYVGMIASLMIFPMMFGLSTTFYFLFWMTPIGGAVQWIITKIAKYALADPAKQMLYIPCSQDEKYKAKSFIDMVGARGGKALASVFNGVCLAPMSSLQGMAYFSYPILLVIILIWSLSAYLVGNKFTRYIEEESIK